MRGLFTLLFVFLILTDFTFTQVAKNKNENELESSSLFPLRMSYQGVLTDQNGSIVQDNNYALTFRIYDALEGGTKLWEEIQNVEVSKGIFNVLLGEINSINLPFDVPYYLAVRIASSSELQPRILLTASPFSFMSRGIFDNTVTTPKILDGAVTQSKLSPGLTIPPGGNAGGDLSGTYPNPVVGKIQGRTISSTAPTSGQVLSWNGSQWTPVTPSSGMGGSGTSNYISKFTTGSTLGNSILSEYNGKLALNRTSASYTLDIGTTIQAQNYIRLTASGSNGILFSDNNDYMAGVVYDHNKDCLQFSTVSGTAWGERMRINANGMVGIGTGFAGPTGAFHVKTSLRYAGYFETDTLNHDASCIYAKFTGTGQYDATGVTAESVPQFGSGKGGEFTGGYRGVSGYGDGGTYNATVFGVYGSATGSPGTRIGVYGTTSGAAATTYGVYASGDLGYTGNIVHASDRKLKTNIAGFSNSLDKVMKLEPRMFSYSTDPKYAHMNLPSGIHYGLIAQELETVFPEMVTDAVHPSEEASENVKGGEEIRYKGVIINELIPVLIQAIKEQEEKIERLEKEIEKLKN